MRHLYVADIHARSQFPEANEDFSDLLQHEDLIAGSTARQQHWYRASLDLGLVSLQQTTTCSRAAPVCPRDPEPKLDLTSFRKPAVVHLRPERQGRRHRARLC